jgi:O-antigen/teichoic acid export membrane protein
VIKTISNTAFTLGTISALNFLIVTLVFRELGQNGTAEMGLVVLGISFILMISNIIGGPALVYLTSRESNFTLLVTSYLWAVISTVLMGFVLFILELVPLDYIWWVVVIGFFECLFSIHNQFFVGKEDMKSHNLLKLIQKITQVLLFLAIEISLDNFVLSLLVSYFIVLSFSFAFTYKKIDSYELVEPNKLVRIAFKYGLQVQVSNIVQMLNYRLLYFFIEKSMGSILGLFIVAVQLSEALWIPSKALSIIQYGKVSNQKLTKKKSVLSVQFLKLSVVITFFLTCILLVVPNSWFVFFFDEEILGIKPLLFSLAIGVLAVTFTQTFAHYFSGIGKYHFLVNGTLVGLSVLLLTGWFLIHQFGIIGAGISTSLTYLATAIYLGDRF